MVVAVVVLIMALLVYAGGTAGGAGKWSILKKPLFGLDTCFLFVTEWEGGRLLKKHPKLFILRTDNDYKDQGDHHHGWWRERGSNKHRGRDQIRAAWGEKSFWQFQLRLKNKYRHKQWRKYQVRQLADCEQRDGGGGQEEIPHLSRHSQGAKCPNVKSFN